MIHQRGRLNKAEASYKPAIALQPDYAKAHFNLASTLHDLGKRIYTLDYERLTVNQEDETLKLITYLDLEWDKKCLSPQNNKRRVTTASNVQVREKVYQGSSQQWKHYKPFLKGLLDGLDD